MFHTAITDHLSENYSNASHPRARIELKAYTEGERDEGDEGQREGRRRREGTARLLKRFKSYIRVRFPSHMVLFTTSFFLGQERVDRAEVGGYVEIQTDFVLLPCDLSAPASLSLSYILDKHRSRPEAVLTAVFYEPVEAIGEGEFWVKGAGDMVTIH